MRDQGLAIYSTTIVILIAFFLFITAIVVVYWMGVQGDESLKVGCGLKLTGYCADWLKSGFDSGSRPDYWSTKDPKDCDSIGIVEPTADGCKGNVVGKAS